LKERELLFSLEKTGKKSANAVDEKIAVWHAKKWPFIL
jgi:hypothetical protein